MDTKASEVLGEVACSNRDRERCGGQTEGVGEGEMGVRGGGGY